VCSSDLDAMKALAIEGARVMRTVPLIGWDIACTEKGPVIVEMNEHPDSFLMQFAERRGLLDGMFRDFVAFQKRNQIVFESTMRALARG
jgi:D-alanine-D-alanine ligase-like ATP-grasp enzyme